MIVCNDLSNSHFTLDVRVRVVACKLEILILEIENTFYLRVQCHVRQRTGLTSQLQLDLLQMIVVYVSVSERMYELARL